MSANSLGFHNLPFLAHRKSVKKGLEFTIMVVGMILSGVHICVCVCVCVSIIIEVVYCRSFSVC